MSDTQPQTVVPGDGPGADYVSKTAIWIILTSFCLIAITLLVLFVVFWPDPDSEPATASVAAVQSSSSEKPAPDTQPTQTTAGPTSDNATMENATSNNATFDQTTSDKTAPAKTPGKNPNKPADTNKPADNKPAETGLKITSISPASSGRTGGTLALISGSGFATGATVKFGESPATDVAVVCKELIRVKVPAHPAGVVDVIVKIDGNTTDLTQGFAYRDALRQSDILLLVLLAGALGGTLYSLISLSWYIGNRELKWSWVPSYVTRPFTAAALACIFFLTLVTGVWTDPTGKGQLWIIGLSALVGLFSKQAYEKLKAIFEAALTSAPKGADQVKTVPAGGLGIDKSSGPAAGGDIVQITGSGFTAATTVLFDTVAATSVRVDSPTVLHVGVPPHAAGQVNVTVTNPGTPPEIRTVKYTYLDAAPAPAPKAPPAPDSGLVIDKSSGPAAGGDTVQITGSGFTAATTVRFDTLAATSVNVNSSTVLQAIAPPHAAGQVDITVTNPGTPPEIRSVKYTYLDAAPAPAPNVPPAPDSGLVIDKSSGPAAGGDTVQITGSGFTAATTVRFDTLAATSVNVNSSTVLQAVAPPHAAGQVDIIVTNPGVLPEVRTVKYTYTP
jgi:hypothetical protein